MRKVAIAALLILLATVICQAATYTYTFQVYIGGEPASGDLYIYDMGGTLVDKAVINSSGMATLILDEGSYIAIVVTNTSMLSEIVTLTNETTVTLNSSTMYKISFTVSPSEVPVFDISFTPLNDSAATATFTIPSNKTLYTANPVNITVPKEVRGTGFQMFYKYVFKEARINGQVVTDNTFTVNETAAVEIVFEKQYALPTLTREQMYIIIIIAAVIVIGLFMVARRGETIKAELAELMEDEFVGSGGGERELEELRRSAGEDEFVGA
ncbi:MAG: hypothetical protein DRJ67_03710 [Thermoprotei archaeon]|nr:MAG: hypothetical protein DRJ67_03710 [Thermoprotei archaeon]